MKLPSVPEVARPSVPEARSTARAALVTGGIKCPHCDGAIRVVRSRGGAHDAEHTLPVCRDWATGGGYRIEHDGRLVRT